MALGPGMELLLDFHAARVACVLRPMIRCANYRWIILDLILYKSEALSNSCTLFFLSVGLCGFSHEEARVDKFFPIELGSLASISQ